VGKLKRVEAVAPLVRMLAENDNKDAFLRHAGATGLAEIGDVSAMLAAVKDGSPAARMGVVLALRRLGRGEIALVLHDADVLVVMEAARAINDVPIESAREDLARLVRNLSLPEVVLHRALNANFRLGKVDNAIAVANLAAMTEAPEIMRVEALEMLEEWA